MMITFSFNSNAAFFIVDRFEDAPDSFPGDTQCTGVNMVGATCSLRAAIMEANATPGPHTILIPAGQDFVLTQTGDDEDLGMTGDLDILQDITISNGLTQGFVIDGNGTDRIFQVHEDARLTLENGLLKNGAANTANTFQGGAIKVEIDGVLIVDNVDFTNNLANRGGAIFNDGEVLIENSYIHYNAITDENEPINLPSEGNAILNRKIMIIATSTLAHNGQLQSNPNNTSINNGEYAIHVNPNGVNAAQPITTIFNSTIANNIYGGLRLNGGIADINQTTVANHNHQGIRYTRRDGIYEGELQLTIRKSVFANNGFQDCNDLWVFYGVMDLENEIDILGNYNVNTDTSCGFQGMENKEDQSVEFNGSLHNWGGHTPTLLPMEHSPVVDFVEGGCSSEDQRGGERPLDGNNNAELVCDAGSVELNRAEDPIDSDLIFSTSFEALL
jgi:hypothetical protein